MDSPAPADAGKLLQAARDAVARGDLDEAGRSYRAYISVASSALDVVAALNELAGDVLRNQGFLRAAQETFEQAEKRAAAAGDDRMRLKALVGLGSLHTQRGSLDATKACLDKALTIMGELTDRRADALVLGNLASLYFNTGRLDEATQAYERSLRADQLTRDRRGEAINLGNLAMVHFARGRAADALGMYDSALAISRSLDSAEHEAHLLVQIGTVHASLGEIAEAEQAFELARQRGHNPSIVALAKAGLALLHDRRGRVRSALELLDQTLLVLRATGDRHVLAFVTSDRATVLGHRGRLAAARRELDVAHDLAAATGNRRLDARIMLTRAQLLHVQGRVSAAWQDVSTCERLSAEVADPRVRAESLATAGLVLGEMGMGEDAAALLLEAREAARSLGERPVELVVAGILASALSCSGEDRARPAVEEALTRSRELGDVREECRAELATARLDDASGDLGRARESADRAIELARKLEDDIMTGEGLTLLARTRLHDDPSSSWEAAEAAIEILSANDAPLLRAQALLERVEASRLLGRNLPDDVREASSLLGDLSGMRAERLRARADDIGPH